MMESNGRPERKRKSGFGLALYASGLVLGTALLTSLDSAVDKAVPENAYETKYTQDGQCLNGTPFDPNEGATVVTSVEAGLNILTVRPAQDQAKTTNTPPNIEFIFKTNVAIKPPDFEASGSYTRSIVREADCPS